jgi:hypothetical protein
MILKSNAFSEGSAIPDKYSKQGGNISPALEWSGVPDDTESLALIVDDPDAPKGLFVHWIAYRIPLDAGKLAEGVPAQPELSNGMRQGANGFGQIGYGGPQPPSGTHRYFFHLYALDTDLEVPPGLSREELDGAIQGHILAEAKAMGTYQHRERTRTA